MAGKQNRDPLWSAALVKMSMIMRGLGDSPGFRVIYSGTLRDLGVTDAQVNAYIKENREELEAQIVTSRQSTGETEGT